MLKDVVLALNGSVDQKALRTVITVRTEIGNTAEGEAEAVLGQGSKGGGLGSMLNLDDGVSDYLADCSDEDVYGSVRLQPLIWVDDVIRSAQGSSAREQEAEHEDPGDVFGGSPYEKYFYRDRFRRFQGTC